MNKCLYCGASFSGFGSKCQACTLRDSIKEENEKNRRQTESLQRESEANARREAHLQREQMDLLARQQRMIAAQQQEIAEQTVAIENEKLKELQKQTRLIEEQAVSTEEAFQAGYRVKNILSNFLVNENQDFFFDESYLTPKLNKSFSAGVDSLIAEKFSKKEVWLEPLMKRIRSIFNEQRDLFVQWSGNLNEKSYDGVFFEQVELIIGDVAINFGVLSTDLGTYVDEETGEVKFKNTEFGPATDCRAVKELFVSCFDPDSALRHVNTDEMRLQRLQAILEVKISQHLSVLEYKRSSNLANTIDNIRCGIFYLFILWSIYLLFSLEFWIFNLIPAFFVFLFGMMIAGDNVAFKKSYDLAADSEKLLELERLLSAYKGHSSEALPRQESNRVEGGRKFILVTAGVVIALGFIMYLVYGDGKDEEATFFARKNQVDVNVDGSEREEYSKMEAKKIDDLEGQENERAERVRQIISAAEKGSLLDRYSVGLNCRRMYFEGFYAGKDTSGTHINTPGTYKAFAYVRDSTTGKAACRYSFNHVSAGAAYDDAISVCHSGEFNNIVSKNCDVIDEAQD